MDLQIKSGFFAQFFTKSLEIHHFLHKIHIKNSINKVLSDASLTSNTKKEKKKKPTTQNLPSQTQIRMQTQTHTNVPQLPLQSRLTYQFSERELQFSSD